MFSLIEPLAVGQVARDVAVTFDRFWNHQLSVPVAAFAGNHDEESLRITRAQASAAMESLADTIYAQALNSMFIESVQSDLQKGNGNQLGSTDGD